MPDYRDGMPEIALTAAYSLRQRLSAGSLWVWFGVSLGVAMPVLSGILFPTYYRMMPLLWWNRAWLLEVHYVAFEIGVIAWAYARGMDRALMWKALPRDIRWATVTLLAAMFGGSVLIAAHPESLLQSLIQVVHLYFAVAVFYLARTLGGNAAGETDRLVRWLTIGLAVLAFYTWWRFSFPPQPSAVPGGQIEWDFALPGFISVRYLGIWCGAVAAGSLIQILYRDRNGRLTFWHVAFTFAAAFAMWSGTRAALLGMAGAAATFFLSMRAWPTARALIVASGLSVLALCLALIFEFDHPAFKLLRFDQPDSLDRFSSGRLELWIATIERWRDSPLLGWGTGSLFWEVHLNWTHTQPHNVILQFLFSWGIVGAIPALWLLGRAVSAAHSTARSQLHLWPLLGVVYALLWMSMVDGSLYYPRFITLIVAGLALILASSERVTDNH